MGDGAQVLHGVTLFLKGILGGRRPFYHNLRGVDFKGLLGFRSSQQRTGDSQGGSHVLGCDLLEIIDLSVLKHHLHTHKG